MVSSQGHVVVDLRPKLIFIAATNTIAQQRHRKVALQVESFRNSWRGGKNDSH
jgi:hypothetical protein